MISYRALEAFSGTPWEEGFEDVKGVRSVIVGGPQFVATEYVLGTFDDLESVIIERPKMISEELIALKVGRVCSTWKTRHVKIGGRSAEDIILKPPIVRFLSLEELRAMGAKA